MTTFDRFDPFERRITDAIDEIAAARPPEYLNDILRQTAGTAQRPRWTFPERWLPVDTALSRPTFFGRAPIRTLVVLAVVVALLVASIAVYVGSQRHLPAPFGPAANGKLIFPSGGDIFVREGITGEQRLLIGGEGEQLGASYSPDGELITYVNSSPEGDHFMVARADGTNPRQLAVIPTTGDAAAAWFPDGNRVGFIYEVQGQPQLSVVDLSGATTAIDLGDIVPLDLSFSPPAGDRMLVRARVPGGTQVGLYTMKPDGSDRKTIVDPVQTDFGPQFTLSGAVWSPDGRTIAYNGIERITATDRTTAEYFRVHLVGADGSNDRVIAGSSDPNVQENWPAFSPDGKWIAVLRWTFKNGVPGATGWIAVMPADGSQVAHDIGPHFEAAVDTGITKTWAPDSSKLLIHVASNQEVYSVDPLTGGSEQLSWTTELPDWQRIALP
jgi:Tol biopolymer transport system component